MSHDLLLASAAACSGTTTEKEYITHIYRCCDYAALLEVEYDTMKHDGQNFPVNDGL